MDPADLRYSPRCGHRRQFPRPPTPHDIPALPPHHPRSLRDVVFVDPWTAPSPVPRSSSGMPLTISPTCPRHGRLAFPIRRGGRGCHGKVSNHGGLLNGLSDDRYTVRLAFTLGLCKILCGVVLVMLGMAALLLQATLAGIGAGIWAGVITLLSGVVALLSSKLPRNYGVLVALLCWSITSLASSGLLVIFAGTGLARDLTDLHRMEAPVGNGTSFPLPTAGGTNSSDAIRWSNESSTANVSDGSEDGWHGGSGFSLHAAFFTNRRPAVVVNATLVTLAVVDCLIAVACITLASAEACPCGVPVAGDRTGASSGAGRWELAWSGARNDRKARQDRLLRWIDQQQVHLLWQNCTPPPYQKPAVGTCLYHHVTGPVAHHTTSSLSQSCFSHDTLNSDLYSKSSTDRHYARVRALPRPPSPSSTAASAAVNSAAAAHRPASTIFQEDNDQAGTVLTDEQILSSYSELDKRLAEDFIRRLDENGH